MGDVQLSVERAEAKTETMRAKAGAIDELADLGVLDDVSGTASDPLSKELAELTASQNVEDELASLRVGLPPADDKRALPGG